MDNIESGGLWQIPVDGFSVNGKSSLLNSRSAIIDSGTSYMFLPPADAEALFQLIPGAAFSDNDVSTLPCNTSIEVALVFNNVAYSISPKDYVGPSTAGGQCQSNIFSQAAVDNKTWLLGDTFMKNVYTVFDVDKNRVGKECTETSRIFGH